MYSIVTHKGYWQLPQGYRLYYRHDAVTVPRARLLLVHGLGEHSGRYDHIVARLNALGIDVIRYDHYGHGRSDGKRGTLRCANQLDQDLWRHILLRLLQKLWST